MTCLVEQNPVELNAVVNTNWLDNFKNGKLPGLFVFDLDFTLWPYDCGKDVWAPFSNGVFGIIDHYGRPANPFPDVGDIMAALVDCGVPIAIASRNPAISEIEALLKTITFDCSRGTISIWDALPNSGYLHAYSSGGMSGKNRHFAALKAVTGVEFNQMLFFDDLPENIAHAVKQGTTSIHVGRTGLTRDSVIAGLRVWRKRV